MEKQYNYYIIFYRALYRTYEHVIIMLFSINNTIYHDTHIYIHSVYGQVSEMFNVRLYTTFTVGNPLTFKLCVSFECHLNIDQSAHGTK